MHILTVFCLVCDVMSVTQLSIMEHNGNKLKEKLVGFASIEEKHNGVGFEHNFLMPKRLCACNNILIRSMSTSTVYHVCSNEL